MHWNRTKLITCSSLIMTSREHLPSNTSKIASIPWDETSWVCISGDSVIIFNCLTKEEKIWVPDTVKMGTIKSPAGHRRLAAENRVPLEWVHQWFGWRCCRAVHICHAASWCQDHLLQSPHRSNESTRKVRRDISNKGKHTSANGSSSSESSPSCIRWANSQTRC